MSRLVRVLIQTLRLRAGLRQTVMKALCTLYGMSKLMSCYVWKAFRAIFATLQRQAGLRLKVIVVGHKFAIDSLNEISYSPAAPQGASGKDI